MLKYYTQKCDMSQQEYILYVDLRNLILVQLMFLQHKNITTYILLVKLYQQ